MNPLKPNSKIQIQSVSHQELDKIPSTDVDTERQIDLQDLQETLPRLLKMLTLHQRKIIALRFGLGPHEYSYTLEETGRIMRMCRERIRGIESMALYKLRRPQYANQLRRFFDNMN